MDFLFQQTSIEQNLTATKAAIKGEEIKEQGLGNHHRVSASSHSPQHTMASNHGGAAEQQGGSTVNIS